MLLIGLRKFAGMTNEEHWVMTRHQYEICALVPRKLFRVENVSCFTGYTVNCKLRSAPACKLADNGEVREEKYNQVKEKT